MAREISQAVTFDATPAVVYRALVDPKHHAAMTGSRATNDGKVGGTFSAYDGYIVGFNVELSKGNRIVQAWRANDWKEGAWSIACFELSSASWSCASASAIVASTCNSRPSSQGARLPPAKATVTPRRRRPTPGRPRAAVCRQRPGSSAVSACSAWPASPTSPSTAAGRKTT
ncbi:MAG: SRPBCC domain-containing protein [Polyangiaceae bacterium]|nr:SRPBCC domain-containing protein [Polyangiaceae bacterium]MCE7892207.1 hypothetical protein [Sorangiineae bacterium PRO1]MCL4754503.1 SRPBCC domain-containing protein [Myxococcales bacterium]